LVRIEYRNTGGYVGLCLEVHDLAISKYIAGQEKDREFTGELARHGMTYRQILLERLAVTKLDAAASKIAKGRIERDFPRATRKR
jgi:hypothetical protein